MGKKIKLVDDYVDARTVEVGELMHELRALIHQKMPDTTEEMQYGVPAFLNAQNVPVIYLFGSKKHVNFGFLRSAEINDPDDVLTGSGKPSKHIRIEPGNPVDKKMLTRFISQCADIVS